MFLRLKYGIIVFNNVLTENERFTLLKESKPLLEKLSESHPGLQTKSDFHLKLDQKGLFYPIQKILKKSKVNGNINKCWVNYTDENIKYISWHKHQNIKNTLVYFIENPENVGTIFRINGKEMQVKASTNSLITFPPSIEHTVPNNITKPRYSLAIDLI
jgi:hypothetical protein